MTTAVFLINRLPSQVLGFDSPYFRLFRAHPDYTNLHPFGCVCFVHLPPPERNKLGAQSVMCAFLGYSTTHKGFLCYDPTSQRLRVSRNVVFFDQQIFFPCSEPSSNGSVTLVDFSNDSPAVERFKPGHVYVRRTPTFPFPPLIRHLNLHPCDAQNVCLTLLIGMDMGILLLVPLYLAHLFLLVILRQLKMFVGSLQ